LKSEYGSGKRMKVTFMVDAGAESNLIRNRGIQPFTEFQSKSEFLVALSVGLSLHGTPGVVEFSLPKVECNGPKYCIISTSFDGLCFQTPISEFGPTPSHVD
jgi:hypothetical protein